MSDKYEPIFHQTIDITQITGQDLLVRVSDMLYRSPPGTDTYIDITFYDSYEEPRIMRLELINGHRKGPTIH